MLNKRSLFDCIQDAIISPGDYFRGWNDAVEAMPKWISVEDEPKQTSDYLVYVWVAYPDGIAQMEMRKAIYNIVHKEWYVDCGRLEAVGKPTHWMPLPEPPKEDE